MVRICVGDIDAGDDDGTKGFDLLDGDGDDTGDNEKDDELALELLELELELEFEMEELVELAGLAELELGNSVESSSFLNFF